MVCKSPMAVVSTSKEGAFLSTSNPSFRQTVSRLLSVWSVSRYVLQPWAVCQALNENKLEIISKLCKSGDVAMRDSLLTLHVQAVPSSDGCHSGGRSAGESSKRESGPLLISQRCSLLARRHSTSDPALARAGKTCRDCVAYQSSSFRCHSEVQLPCLES
jgi:hypothetical protein